MSNMLNHCALLASIALTVLSLPGQSAAGVPCDPTFTALPVFEVGYNNAASALADLNGDGRLDLTTGRRYFLGDGTGTFLGSYTLAIDSSTSIDDVTVRDFDGDGSLDLALPSSQQAAILLFFATEAREIPAELFNIPLTLPTLPRPFDIADLDVDADGLPDLVAASFAGGDIALHINNGGRTFADTEYLPMELQVGMLAAGDFDGDGHADIAVGHDARATILFGRGDGAFTSGLPSILATAEGTTLAHRISAADLDQDGRSELIAVCDAEVLIYRGTDIDPVLGLPPVCSLYYPLQETGRFLEIADMNADGVLDIIVQTRNESSSSVVLFSQVPGGDLTFVAGTPFSTELPGRWAVLAVGDVNGDTWIDIVITTGDSREGRVFLNAGNCCAPLFADPGDANADGALDIGDPVAILGYLFGSQPLRCEAAAEVNGDRQINLADPIYLLTYLFAQGTPPPSDGPRNCSNCSGDR